jgi:phage shock protein A
MLKFLAMVAALAAALTTGLYYGGPEFRTEVDRCWYDWTGWTEEARQNDPDGFMRYAERRLRADLATLEDTRQGLRRGLAEVQREHTKQTAQLEHADGTARLLRDAYRQADEVDAFPVEVRGEAFTRDQVERRVGTLLAEAESCRASLEHLAAIRQQAEDKLEALSVQIDGTQAQLASMGVRREMVRAQLLSEQDQQVVAEVAGLMNANQATIAEPPASAKLRQVEIERGRVTARPSLKSAREFLQQRLERRSDEGKLPFNAQP